MLFTFIFYYMLSHTIAFDEDFDPNHSFDNSVELDDSINLVAMDQHLTRLLTHPQPRQGVKLLNDSEKFCGYLDKVLDLVDEKDPKGTEYYKKLAHVGGVRFANTTYDPEKVKKTYKYSEHEFEELEGTIREIQSIWKCIGVLLNVTLPDSGEHFREKALAAVRARELARGEVIPDNETISLSSSEIDWF